MISLTKKPLPIGMILSIYPSPRLSESAACWILSPAGLKQIFTCGSPNTAPLWKKSWGGSSIPEAAAVDLLSQRNPKPGNVVSRLGERLLETISLETLESGPPAGQWREERLAARRADRLFTEILVPVNGEPRGWFALDQAILIAQKESGGLRGLHVVAYGSRL